MILLCSFSTEMGADDPVHNNVIIQQGVNGLPTSYPLDESRCCTYKGYDVRTQRGSRGWYSIQGVRGTQSPCRSARCPRFIFVFSRAPPAARKGYLNSYLVF